MPTFEELEQARLSQTPAAPLPSVADLDAVRADSDVAQRIIAAQSDVQLKGLATRELQTLPYQPAALRKQTLAKWGYAMPGKPMQAVNAITKGVGALVDTIQAAPVVSSLPLVGQSPRDAMKQQEARELSMPSEGFTDTAGRAIGSALPFAAATLATGGAAAPAMLGAASGMGAVRQDIAQVEDRTGTVVPWYKAAPAIVAGGVVEGATEFAGAKLMGGLGRKLGGNLAGSMMGGIAKATLGASASNAVEEGAAEVGYNAIANIYDPAGRNLGEGVPQAAIGGAIGGPVMGAIAAPAAAQARYQANTAQAQSVMGANTQLTSAPMPNREKAIISWLTRATGAKVQPVTSYDPQQSPDGPINVAMNGGYDPKSRTYYLNTAKPNVAGIALHEAMGHGSTAEFRSQFAAKFPQLAQWGQQESQRRGETRNVEEEGVAYAIERMAQDPAMLNQVAQQAPGLMTQFRDGFAGFLDSVSGGNRTKARMIREQMGFLSTFEAAAKATQNAVVMEQDQAFDAGVQQDVAARVEQQRQQGIAQEMAGDEQVTAQRQAGIRQQVEQQVTRDEINDNLDDRLNARVRDMQTADAITDPQPIEGQGGLPADFVQQQVAKQAILNPAPIEGQGGMTPGELNYSESPKGSTKEQSNETTPIQSVAAPANSPVAANTGSVRGNGDAANVSAEPQAWRIPHWDIRKILSSGTKEGLEQSRPLLKELYSDMATAEDPWGIRRAIEKGDSFPRVPFMDLSFRHKAAIREAMAQGKTIPAEVLADYEEFAKPTAPSHPSQETPNENVPRVQSPAVRVPEANGEAQAEPVATERMPYDEHPLPTAIFRGTEAGTPGAELRVSPAGELGKALYGTADESLAKSYGGGPKASVRKGTRKVHRLEFTRTIYPEEIGYLKGGAAGGDAVLLGGGGVELWRGPWSASKSERANVEEMNRVARENGIKVLVGLDDSVAINQIGILDPSIVKPVAPAPPAPVAPPPTPSVSDDAGKREKPKDYPPQAWLMGATRADIAAGMHPTEATAKAVRTWQEQGKQQPLADEKLRRKQQIAAEMATPEGKAAYDAEFADPAKVQEQPRPIDTARNMADAEIVRGKFSIPQAAGINPKIVAKGMHLPEDFFDDQRRVVGKDNPVLDGKVWINPKYDPDGKVENAEMHRDRARKAGLYEGSRKKAYDAAVWKAQAEAVAKARQTNPVETASGNTHSVDYMTPSGERRTLVYREIKAKDLTDDERARLRKRLETHMVHKELDEARKIEKALSGKGNVTVEDDSTSPGHRSVYAMTPADAFRQEVRYRDLHDAKFSDAAKATWEKIGEEHAAKLKATADAEAKAREDSNAAQMARSTYQQELKERVAQTRWKQGTAQIEMANGEKRSISGAIVDGLMLHKSDEAKAKFPWEVTHIDSSRVVSRYRTQAEAKAAIINFNDAGLGRLTKDDLLGKKTNFSGNGAEELDRMVRFRSIAGDAYSPPKDYSPRGVSQAPATPPGEAARSETRDDVRYSRDPNAAKYPQTETAEFKAWFKDSAVRDAQGKPLVVYHGTTKEFSEFQTPAYFASSADEARVFAEEKDDGDASVMDVYLSIRNPMIVREFGEFVEWDAADVEKAKAKGHDGVIMRASPRGKRIGEPDLYMAFSPTQIKSATANTGTFSPDNPDIRYSRDPRAAQYKQAFNDRLDDADTIAGQKTELHNLTLDVRELDKMLKGASDADAISRLQKSLVQTIKNNLPDNDDRVRLLNAVASTTDLATYAKALDRLKAVYADSAVRKAAREASDMVVGGLDAKEPKIRLTRRETPDVGSMTPEEFHAHKAKVVDSARRRMLNKDIDLTLFDEQNRAEIRGKLAMLRMDVRTMKEDADPEEKMEMAAAITQRIREIKTLAADLLGNQQAIVADKIVEIEATAQEGGRTLAGKKPNALQRSLIGRLFRANLNPRTIVPNIFGENSIVTKLLVSDREQDRTNKHRHDMERTELLGRQLEEHLGIKAHSKELHDYLNKKEKVTLSGGAIEISKGDAVTLWGMYTDPQLRARFEGGELVRTDDDDTITGKMTFHARDVEKLEAMGFIDAKVKAMVKAIKDSIKGERGQLMDAKLEISGWAPDTHDGYWPTERYVISRQELPSGYIGMAKALENRGFFEERTFSGKNPYVIRDFVSVISRYNQDAGEVIHRAAGVRAANAIVENETFKRAVEGVYGADGVRALTRYIENLAGTKRKPNSVPEKGMKWLTKNYGRALIALNPKVMGLNIVSGPIATYAMFEHQDWTYGVKHMFDKDVHERMMRHPDLWARYNGEMYSHITLLTGESIPSIATMRATDAAKAGKFGQAVEAIKWMEKADQKPMAQIVASAEHWAARTMSEATQAERDAAVEAKVRDVVFATQNGGGPTELSTWASIFRDNAILAPLVMFTSDQNKKLNMLARAIVKRDKAFAAKAIGGVMATSLIYAGLSPGVDKLAAELFRLIFGGETPPEENAKLIRRGIRRGIGGIAGQVYFGEKLVEYVDAVINERTPDMGSPVAVTEALYDAGNAMHDLVAASVEADPEKQGQQWAEFEKAFWRSLNSGRLAAGDPTVPVMRDILNAAKATGWTKDDVAAFETKEMAKDAKSLNQARNYRKRAAMLMDDDPEKARGYLDYAEELEQENAMEPEEVARVRRYNALKGKISATKAKVTKGVMPGARRRGADQTL
jgi:hypothetical protein